MSVFTKAAFRCKNCGHLEGPEAAGENAVPHACSVCGAGIVLNPRTHALAQDLARPELTAEERVGIANEMMKIARTGEQDKHADPDNWEVLDGADEEHLKTLGLDRERVAKHEGRDVRKGAVTRPDGTKPARLEVGAEVEAKKG